MMAENDLLEKVIKLLKDKKGQIYVRGTGTIDEVIENTKEHLEGLRESKKEKITHVVSIVYDSTVLRLEGDKKMVENLKEVIPEKTYNRIMGIGVMPWKK